MGAINLTEEPTFELPVRIPRVGREDAEVRFTFKHRTVDEFNELVKRCEAGEFDAQMAHEQVLELASGWSLKDEFTEANVKALCQGYIGACGAVTRAYFREYTRARLGN